ncbi:MAG: DUF4845 domain-containing protein [Gallionella sp.]
MPKQQTGLTISGFLLWAFMFVVLVLFGFKLVPAYMENSKIQSIFEEVARDPAMQKASARELQASFDRRASVNWVDAIKSGDIEITQDDNGHPVLSASYPVKIKLGGNVSLLLEFHPTSARK